MDDVGDSAVRRGRSFKFNVEANGEIGKIGKIGRTTATIYRAADPIQATLILAHGAGAPHSHPFMIDIASRIAARGVDVVTFNFLYAEAGRKLPDRAELLEATWRAAISSVRVRSGLPTERLFIGGKSMGGRIATRLAADPELTLAGLVLLGYPLRPKHKPGPDNLRREILDVTNVPILIVQGTRDDFGTAAELGRFVRALPRAKVHAVSDGDHSLVIRRRAGQGGEEQESVLTRAADAIASFLKNALPS